ncbi:MAG: antibiotic biosynthesis monooxygenase [Victivallaceae bacterium]|nr:antibiotic biosynthesis monooxygenase [Victivallaceae bacterium]
MKEITIFCPIYAAPGKKEALRAALRLLAEKTRAENGNICYRPHEAVNADDKFMIYEQWRDQEALDFHMRQPYLTEFLADREGLLADEIRGVICSEMK